MANLFNEHILISSMFFDWLFWKWALKHLFFFLNFCCIITTVSGIIDHYCIMENFKKNQEKIRINYEQHTLKLMKILRTVNHGSNFTGSYKKKGVEEKTIPFIKKFLCFKNLVKNLILTSNKLFYFYFVKLRKIILLNTQLYLNVFKIFLMKHT